MSQDSLSADVLRKIPLFDHMNDSERRQLAEAATIKQCQAGEEILRQGNKSQNLWIVLEGQCEVYKESTAGDGCGPVMLAVLEPYSSFGEMTFFHPDTHSASVRAKTPVKLMKMERLDYDELVQDGASAAYKLACNAVDCLAERLRRMDDWVAELKCNVPTATASAVNERVPEWTAFRDKLFTGWNL